MNQKELAKKIGVSSATISRVINNRGHASDKTVEYVMNAIEEYDYVPNEIARQLKTSSTKIIGYLVPDITNPFFTAMLAGFEESCYLAGYDVIFENTNESLEKEKKALETLLRLRVDGLLAAFIDADCENIKRNPKNSA